MLAVGRFFAFLSPARPTLSAVSPVPPDGPGPNPLLQNHILMVIHPPMLYLGYVGMAVPFGLPWRRCCAASWARLAGGPPPLDAHPVDLPHGGHHRSARWWAYAVLGWGGYWAWDPVENASFLPWLTATAFIHSAMVRSGGASSSCGR